jgi:hypothetical protein
LAGPEAAVREIRGDFTDPWPIPADFLDQVVGNRFPGMYGPPLQRMLGEAARCLKSGGVIELWTVTDGTGPNLVKALEESGLFSKVEPWRGNRGVRAVK